MSRIIKFRAWDESQKHMAYQGTPDLETIQSFMHHFGDKTLMQFTGFKDLTGKEIYEGDIIRSQGQDYCYIQIIEFHNTHQSCGRGWIGRNIIRLGKRFPETPDTRIDERFSYFSFPLIGEVIGNIYEQPEILEVTP